MKEIKKFPGFDKHLRYYIALSIFINITGLCFYAWLLLTQKSIFLDFIEISAHTFLLGAFIALSMVIMGMYYLRVLTKIKNK